MVLRKANASRAVPPAPIDTTAENLDAVGQTNFDRGPCHLAGPKAAAAVTDETVVDDLGPRSCRED